MRPALVVDLVSLALEKARKDERLARQLQVQGVGYRIKRVQPFKFRKNHAKTALPQGVAKSLLN
jgi:hypothetical protein